MANLVRAAQSGSDLRCGAHMGATRAPPWNCYLKSLGRHVCLCAGSERLTVTVNGAKVEYSKSLDRPFFSMSLHDASGKRLEPVQDTPPGHFDRRTFIITAGHDLHFKTPMRQIPPGEKPVGHLIQLGRHPSNMPYIQLTPSILIRSYSP